MPAAPDARASEDTSAIRIAHQNRRRLIPFHMHRGQAPAQIVIIHAGQIIMHQRIGVQRLDRRRRLNRLFRRDAMQRGPFHHQKRPQPLAALNGIAHRIHHGLIGIARQHVAQMPRNPCGGDL
jgi:hypothetical protein